MTTITAPLLGALTVMGPEIATAVSPAESTPSESGDTMHQERMDYIRELVQEREKLSGNPGCEVARRLIEQELERVQSGKKMEEKRTLEVTKEKSIKVTVKVLVPVREHPKFNFVGKLLGPKGNSLKRLQEETMTKMAILGRGSFRDKAKEEELRKNPDPKYSHLHEELHVEVTAHAPPAEAYARIAYALTEIRRYLVPDHNDEIRQEQMREMQVLSGRQTMLTVESGDTQTDTSGSLSPPNSISPPPTAPVKLPTHQLGHPTGHPAMPPTLLTHPALRGLMPNFAAPTMTAATMVGRFPFFPLGSMPQLAAQPARSIPMYEDYSELAASYQPHEFDPALLTSTADDKKEAAMKSANQLNRAKYRHDPYRRLTINVPS